MAKKNNNITADTKLNARQKQFCLEYIKDFSGTNAAIRSGYSVKTAAFIASENLNKPNIEAEIRRLQTKVEKKALITQEEIIERLKDLAFDQVMNPVANKDQIKALELLGKTVGMFTTTKTQLEVSGSLTSIVDIDAESVRNRLLALSDLKDEKTDGK